MMTLVVPKVGPDCTCKGGAPFVRKDLRIPFTSSGSRYYEVPYWEGRGAIVFIRPFPILVVVCVSNGLCT